MRRAVIDLAAEDGLKILAAGTHPFSSWMDQEITPFRAISGRGARPAGSRPEESDLRGCTSTWVSRTRNSSSMPCGCRGIFSHTYLRCRRAPRSGLEEPPASSHTEVCSGGISLEPASLPTFHTYAEYEHILRSLVSANAIKDASKIWWDSRPHHLYPTLEFRLCDICTRVDEAVCIAAIIQAIVAKLVEAPT